MKNQLLLIVMIAVLAASCQKSDNGMSLSQDPQSGSALKNNGVPFKGAMLYTQSTTLNLPCNCGAMSTVGNFDGQGNITHFGLLKSKNKTCASPIMAGSIQIGNHIVIECGSFVAANGDEIYVNIAPYDIYFGNTAASGTMSAEFAGGTGRFANATGSFTGTITVPYSNPNTVSLTNINGTINY